MSRIRVRSTGQLKWWRNQFLVRDRTDNNAIRSINSDNKNKKNRNTKINIK